MLGDSNVMTNIAVKDLAESKKFYGEVLGLKVAADTDFGVQFSSGKRDGRLFVYNAPTAGTGQATIASWEVKDIQATVAELDKAGVKFESYDFPGVTKEGHVHIMGTNKGAWFRDPSGNILGLSQND